ncbi:SLC13 family permease [Streptomyces lividans]|uniref:Carrier protein membrane protein n=2 Tax=Streptomyces lividans TaxID=1916 RepID=A0ABN4DX99_STRLI|nr:MULTISPECIES: SLC13 family permease [Streptomyces]QSJ11590.1 carrier protein membrane protein [Streptomyces lividans]AIJ16009.1 carrier protein membrane protein [Streptomyces lividans TK24]EFD69451.1 carrier protein membrane protein [Streptomyces lividans TK24]EOY47492.1 putative dicarboxylate carrier protein [Streptomyces lividans 1326]KKD16320.1 DeoR faimly transcriptional regulator [Streptomyces sp. WM6391]
MSPELISILVLVVVFVIATTRSVNMGALAFAAAFGVGTLVADLDADGIFAGFPGDLFVVLVGVTYLFAIARANGTTDWLVHAAVRLVRGRVALIPWVMFALTGALTAIGAVSPAAVAIVAPVALSFATRYSISPLLMGTMVVHGAQAGGFSPISIYGSIVNGIVEREKLPGSEIGLFLASLVANLLIAAVLFAVLGGRKLWARGAVTPEGDGAPGKAGTGTTGSGSGSNTGSDTGTSAGTGGTAPAAVAVRSDRETGGAEGTGVRLTPARVATLVALVALVVAVLGFDLDAGLTAVTLAVVLSTAWPDASRRAVGEIAWSTVLLICGVLTYVGVLEEMGTITWAGEGVGGIGVPLLAAVLLCYIGAIVSAFASSVGIMGALIPLAVPFLAQGEIGAVGMVAALAVSATVVDVSPFSTNGALVLAAAPDVDRDRFFRQLMVYGGIVVAAVPALAWLVLVVPGFG